jgi:thymidylate synthase ThyX
MKIIEPKVELWRQEDAKAHVARCARVCYGKETGNDEATIKRLIDSEHWSMFRHGTYYIIANDSDKTLETIVINYANTIGFSYHYEKHVYYITVNGNWALDHKVPFEYLSKYIVPIEDFCNTEIGFHMMRYTFCVDTQISTSRELNRVSPNSIAEMSTRYVYKDGSICRPHWISQKEAELFNNDNNADLDEAMNVYLNGCKRDFEEYKILVDKYKIHRQDARGVLPLDTATRCVYTYSTKEWFDIIKKRVYHTTGKAHPNATIICKLIEQELNELGYEIKI